MSAINGVSSSYGSSTWIEMPLLSNCESICYSFLNIYFPIFMFSLLVYAWANLGRNFVSYFVSVYQNCTFRQDRFSDLAASKYFLRCSMILVVISIRCSAWMLVFIYCFCFPLFTYGNENKILYGITLLYFFFPYFYFLISLFIF